MTAVIARTEGRRPSGSRIESYLERAAAVAAYAARPIAVASIARIALIIDSPAISPDATGTL